MFSRRISTERGRKVTPPSPSYMTNEQFASYLSELRRSRLSRPGGAREQPVDARSKQRDSIGSMRPPPPPPPPAAEQETSHSRGPETKHSQNPPPALPRAPSQISSSVRSRYSMDASARDYYPETPVAPLKPSEVVPTSTYIERGQRWMEKEEAYSLRHAMEDMDLKDRERPSKDMLEDQRLHEAALQEASELVWQHQHGVPSKPEGPYRYRPHLRKNSYAHARTASVGKYGDEIQASGLARDCSRSVSGSSTDSGGFATRKSLVAGEPPNQMHEAAGEVKGPLPLTKSYSGIVSGKPAVSTGRRRSSMKRNISGEIEKPFCGHQIWEEPRDGPRDLPTPSTDDHPHPAASASRSASALENKGKNPLNRVHFSPRHGESTKSDPKLLSNIDIHRNPPTRSRNPQYVTNSRPTFQVEAEDVVSRKNGVEVRGNDIRQATSMKLKDRSEKLPTPSAVSDNPGRPIVSFDAKWTPPEEKADQRTDRGRGEARTPVPSIFVDQDAHMSSSTPSIAVPSIIIDEGDTRSAEHTAPPTITVDGCGSGTSGTSGSSRGNIPVIVTPDDDARPSARPLPQPGSSSKGTGRHARRPRAQLPPSGPPGSLGAALCHECGFPIQGRFVALAGSSDKFHPQCFSCYACGTSLEALEISPEPDSFRSERLDRIRRRAAGEILDESQGKTMAEDGDERLRFYCHLDWHELFAPRCKHCKTPIIGEHIVALGDHWHYGHFFCAECGDPFEQGMTHIEKDGYAWCINCQTKRTERRAPKCKKCRLAVVGQYIQALGNDWHEACFRCATCSGAFVDGQIFPKEDETGSIMVLCTGCRARELKQ